MASGKRSAWKRRVREFCNYLLCLVLGGIFLFMGLTQPIYTEENTMEIYSDSEEALMSSQGLIRFVSVSIPAIIGGLGMRLLKSQSWKLMVRCVFHCVIPTESGKPAG